MWPLVRKVSFRFHGLGGAALPACVPCNHSHGWREMHFRVTIALKNDWGVLTCSSRRHSATEDFYFILGAGASTLLQHDCRSRCRHYPFGRARVAVERY